MPIATKIAGHISKSSWIRKMFEEGERLRQVHGADKVFDFTIGNPDVEPPQALKDELRQLAVEPIPGMHRYMSNAGYEETRAAVAEVLAEASVLPVKSGHVIMTCGAGGALNVVLKTMLNPGEEVIILAPFFVEYKFYIDNHGGVPRPVQTDANFDPDPKAIAAASQQHTRTLLVHRAQLQAFALAAAVCGSDPGGSGITGVEGKFFVWSEQDVMDALKKAAEAKAA